MPDESLSFEPQFNNYLIGHDDAEQLFLRCWKNNSLHNSWLISGIKGIGKATLAFRLARFILNADENNGEVYNSLEVSSENKIFKLIAGNAHPDFKLLQRDYIKTDRRKIQKAIESGEALDREELKNLKKSAYIVIDDVRTINEFLSHRSSGDGWRVVLIDSIDDMNSSAANSVLKILEEPPYKTLMLLISHNPNRLLPTIRSRCAKLELKPLKDAEVASLLRRYRSQLAEDEIKKITSIASGSIGKALRYADNKAANCYNKLENILNNGENFKLSEALDFCDNAVKDEDSYDLVQELLLKFLALRVQNTAKITETADCWSRAIKTFNEVEGLNLDKKQALIGLITTICKQI